MPVFLQLSREQTQTEKNTSVRTLAIVTHTLTSHWMTCSLDMIITNLTLSCSRELLHENSVSLRDLRTSQWTTIRSTRGGWWVCSLATNQIHWSTWRVKAAIFLAVVVRIGAEGRSLASSGTGVSAPTSSRHNTLEESASPRFTMATHHQLMLRASPVLARACLPSDYLNSCKQLWTFY